MKPLHIIVSLLLVVSLACSFSGNAATEPDTPTDSSVQPVSEQRCGDGVCDGPETSENCSQDCGSGDQSNESPPATQASQPTEDTSQSPLPTKTSVVVPTSETTVEQCDLASFITDVTVPDESTFSAGETFTKTWRLKNIGTCRWTSGYKLAFVSGELMSGSPLTQLTSSPIAPGQNLDISVDLTAPSSAGTYVGFWMIQNGSGQQVEIDNSPDDVFWTEINVSPIVSPIVPFLPSFTMEYVNTHTCSGKEMATFKIKNTGEKDFKSSNIKLDDLDASSTLLHVSGIKPFILNATGCGPGNETAEAGGVYYIIGSLGTSPPSGHEVKATIKLCTGSGLSGTCVSKDTTFIVP